MSDARVWEYFEQWGGLFFISEIHVFYGKISNTCSYFAKGNQDVELVKWNAAQVFYKNS